MTKTTSLLAAASLLLPACASAPPGSGIARRWSAPAADRIARLPAWDRGAVEVQGELLRLATRPDTAEAGEGDRGGAAPAGPTVVAIQDAGGTPTYTYVGPLGGYRGGLLARAPRALASLAEAWAASAFHDPVQAKVGASEVWCTLDKFPTAAGAAPGYRLILMVSRGNPRAAAAAAPARAKRGGRRGALAMQQQTEAAAAAGAFWKAELSVTEPPQGNLGVSVDLSTAVASQARGGLPASVQGALVRAVSPGGPAERAGIRPGDLIQGVGGQPVPTSEALGRAVSGRAPFTAVTVSVQRGPDRQQVPATLGLRATSDKLIEVDGVVATLGDVWLGPDGRLGAVSFAPWRHEVAFFLAGKTSKDLFPGTNRWYDHNIEQAINDTVVDWKTRQLPGWLRQATVEELQEAIVTTEKGILALDLAVRSVKDEIDSAARNNLAGYTFAGQVDQALEQRKMLLGVALQAFKGTTAQRAR